jgi:hypothetical protein
VTALVVGLTVAVALLAFLVAGLLRSNAEILRALHQMGVDLDPSAPAAGPARPVSVPDPTVRPTPQRPAATDIIDLTGTTPGGDAISLAVAGVEHDTLAAFLTSGCATCRGFWEAFRQGTPDVPGGARLVAVTRGPASESPGAVGALAGATPVVMSDDAWEHYDIPHAPYFVYISGAAGKVVGEGVAAGWEEVRTLVANAVADGTTAPPPSTARRPRSRADQARDDAVDRQLRAAGIQPGDARLYPTSITSSMTPTSITEGAPPE